MARSSLLLAVSLAVACGGALRKAPVGAHPGCGTEGTAAPAACAAEPVVVDYPPPPAQVESVTADPGSPCVWIDGHWDWVGRRWQWFPGGWVTAPDGCYYAPPTFAWAFSWRQRTERGELYYTRPRWYPDDAAELEPQQILSACAEVRACGATE